MSIKITYRRADRPGGPSLPSFRPSFRPSVQPEGRRPGGPSLPSNQRADRPGGPSLLFRRADRPGGPSLPFPEGRQARRSVLPFRPLTQISNFLTKSCPQDLKREISLFSVSFILTLKNSNCFQFFFSHLTVFCSQRPHFD